MKKNIVFLGILLVMLGIMGIGCYTILTHPRVEGEEEAIEHTGRYYREHCTDCHGDYHNYPYGFYYGYYPDYYWSSPRWGHYYAYPWWWDRYWWDDDYYYDDEEYVPESAEKVEKRRGLEPPYVLPGGTSSKPYIVPSSTKETKSSGTEIKEKPTPTKIETQEKKEEPEPKKPTKRRTD